MSGNSQSSKLLENQLREIAELLGGAAIPVRAHAKVNLRLKVLGRREDGYHLLSMLNCTVSLCDELGISFCSTPGVTLRVEPSGILEAAPSENLAVRAFVSFWQGFGFKNPPVGISCFISKKIPIGAGLGGGSSDAGAVLRVLTATFGDRLRAALKLSAIEYDRRVQAAALSCGADVPYAYVGGLCAVGGIGEHVGPISGDHTSGYRVLLMVPSVPVPTKSFYDRFRARYPVIEPAEDRQLQDFVRAPQGALIELIENDFEGCVSEMVPEVASALKLARGYFPHSTALTGSGCAIFSLVKEGEVSRMRELSEAALREGLAVFDSLPVGD